MANSNAFPARAVLLLVATAAVSAGVVAWQIARDAGGVADRTLTTLQLTQELVEAQLDRDLTTRGELIAGNQAVVGYMTQALGSALPGVEVDHSSIVDLLEERRTQLGLDVAAAVGADGKLLATTDRYLETHDFAKDPVFAAALKAQAPRTGLWLEGERLLHAALLPLARYGSGDAYLVVGRWVGDEYAKTIAGIATGEVAILVPSSAGSAVAVSTLDASDSAALVSHLRGRPVGDGPLRVVLSTRKAEAASAALFGNDAVRVVMLARSTSLPSIAAAHLPTILFAIAVVLTLAIGLLRYRRQVAQPLDALERLMRRAAETGDHHLKASEEGAPAVARLAAAFNQLMGNRQALASTESSSHPRQSPVDRSQP